MKLLIVSQYFWPETFGINRQVLDLVASGVEVTVLTGKPNYPTGIINEGYKAWGTNVERYRGITINRIPMIPRGSASSLHLIFNYFSFVFFGLIYGPWLLRRQTFDAILVYAPSPILQAIPAIFLSRLKRIPVVVWVQDLWPHSLNATGHVHNKYIIWIVDCVVRWIYQSSDLLLVQSQAFVETVRKQTNNKNKILFLPNSAELDAGNVPNPVNSELDGLLSLIRTRFSVVFTGNVGTAQSMHTIVEAATLCKSHLEICFFVVGTGSESKWLSQEIKNRKLENIIATGWLPEKDMPLVLDASSVLLVSLCNKPIFHQTIPNKLQHYLAAGKPIVACLGGEGARVLRESGAGLVCNPEEAPALATNIIKIAAMPESDRTILGQSGQKYFKKHFDPKVLTSQLIIMLSDLIDENTKLKT